MRLFPLLLSCLVACDSTSASHALQGSCDFGDIHEVVQAPGLGFDGVAIAPTPSGALAVWSEPRGLYVRRLTGTGEPEGTERRLAERCRGGVQATGGAAQEVALACLRPQGHAVLYRLDPAGNLLGQQAMGPAGRDSKGIALVTVGDGHAVAWHDGSEGSYAARLATVGQAGLSPARTLSDPAFAAGAPSLTLHKGRVVAALAEARFTGGGEVATRIQVATQNGSARSLGESSVTDAAPQLTVDSGQLWVAFRDRRRKNQRAQLFATPLSSSLRATGKPRRVGRANSEGDPRLVSCADERFALTPRVYGGEMYIGVHALDPRFEHVGSGHQYYENSREFVRAAGLCREDGMLVFAAERAPPSRPGTRAIAVPFRCAR